VAGTAAVPRAEIGLGYAYLWDDRMNQIRYYEDLTTTIRSDPKLSSNFWAGGVLSANFNLTNHLGIVTEVSGHHQSQTVQGSHVDVNVLGLHAGVRYTDRQDAVATPYAQFLWGMTRFSAKADLLDHVALSFRPDTNFSIQPGVGVMFRASDHVRIGLGGDYRLVFTGPATDPLQYFPPYKTNEFRLHAGLVFQLGERGGQGTPAPPAELQPLPSGAPPQAVGEAAVPGAEIGLGYAYLWDDRMSQIRYREDPTFIITSDPKLSSNFWIGGVLSANFNVTDRVGIVTEVSGHHQSQTVQGSLVDINVLGVHAGIRYTDREDNVATPYAQFLLGMTRFSAEADLLDHTTLSFRPDTNFSIQPGIGVMFRVSDRVRIGLGGDYRLVFTEPATDPLLSFPNYKTNEFRLHAGIVFGVGTR
jgi:opacity protein-like surface antigen